MRIVKAEGNLQLDHHREQFAFLLWLYLACNQQMTASALEATVRNSLRPTGSTPLWRACSPARGGARMAGREGAAPSICAANRAGERRVTGLLRRMGERMSPEKREAYMPGWGDWPGAAAQIGAMVAVPNGAGVVKAGEA